MEDNDRLRLANALRALRHIERIAECRADDLFGSPATALGEIRAHAAIAAAKIGLGEERAHTHAYGRLSRHNAARKARATRARPMPDKRRRGHWNGTPVLL